MAVKKRDSTAMEEVVNKVNQNVHGEKKIKREKKKKKGADESPVSVPSSTTHSIVSMERKKKRKTKDKERNRATTSSHEEELKPKNQLVNKVDDPGRSKHTFPNSNGLPEFHVRVINDLSLADASLREAAVESIVRELQDVQTAYENRENNDDSEDGLKLEAKKEDGLDNCAPPLRYAVRRLIRGVSSSRECARQGFALGLTVLVGTIRSIKIDALLKLIVDTLPATSSMKGQDMRDNLLGRLFAYGAIARSKRLSEDWKTDQDASHIVEFIGSVVGIASKKRYLQEPAVSIILELMDKVPAEVVLNEILEAPGLGDWFHAAIEAGNPDALLLALKMREKISVDSIIFGKLLPRPYTAGNFFTAEHLSSISNCLKESTFCQPRVHSIWPILVNIILPDVVLEVDSTQGSHSGKKHKKNRKSSLLEEEVEKNLKCFCEVALEGSLLLSSRDRKHLVYDLLLLLLKKLPASCIPIVLSYKIVQSLMDILSTKDSWLYKVAQHFLKELSDWVKYDDVRRVAVIVALQKHSNGKFDCITRTKTVKDMLAGFETESGCMLFIQNLMDIFLDGHVSDEPSDQSQTTDDNSEIGSVEEKDVGLIGNNEFLKSWIIDSLPNSLKHWKLDAEVRFRVQNAVLKFIAIQGIFSSSLGTEVTSFDLDEKFRWPKAAISTALCRKCIEQVQLLLANAQKGEGSRLPSVLENTNELGSYFMRFLGTLYNIPSVSLFRVLNDDDEKTFKKLQAVEEQLSREERNCGMSGDANKVHALRYLLIQLLLQVLLHPGEFSEAASELIICCKKAFPSPDNPESSGDDEQDLDEVPAVMDVLVDTLLSLLPQAPTSMCSAIEQVFKYFCKDITDDGLLRMLRVIKKDLKPARHQEEDSEEDDLDDDVLNIEEAEEESNEVEMNENGDSDEEQTDESEGVLAADTTTEIESVDASDDGMDDDQMFSMDKYLVQIFRERKNQAGGETAHSQLIIFKLRVLTLLEIYLHENPGKPMVLKVYSNLAQAFVNPHTTEGSEQLGQRLWGILQKKILKAKDYPRGDSLELSALEVILAKNLKLASKPFKKKKSSVNQSKKKQSLSMERHKMITTLAQSTTYWILKIMKSRKTPDVFEFGRVVEIFQGALLTYFDSKNSQLKLEFLKEIVRRWQWVGHSLLGFLLEKCSNSKSEFRRVEALELVTEILKPVGSDGVVLEKFKNNMTKVTKLIEGLVTNMPEKQARRAEVRKFCGKIFQIVKNAELSELFLKSLDESARAACVSQFGELFLSQKPQKK